MDHTLIHTHFSMYDNNLLVKQVYVKLLKEEEGKYRVVEFFFY